MPTLPPHRCGVAVGDGGAVAGGSRIGVGVSGAARNRAGLGVGDRGGQQLAAWREVGQSAGASQDGCLSGLLISSMDERR